MQVIRKLQEEIETSHATAHCEKAERMKLIELLRGTIEQVRAAGHEEERLQCQLAKATQSLTEERQRREKLEQGVAYHHEELRGLKRDLAERSEQLLGSQKFAKDQAISV